VLDKSTWQNSILERKLRTTMPNDVQIVFWGLVGGNKIVLCCSLCKLYVVLIVFNNNEIVYSSIVTVV